MRIQSHFRFQMEFWSICLDLVCHQLLCFWSYGHSIFTNLVWLWNFLSYVSAVNITTEAQKYHLKHPILSHNLNHHLIQAVHHRNRWAFLCVYLRICGIIITLQIDFTTFHWISIYSIYIQFSFRYFFSVLIH